MTILQRLKEVMHLQDTFNKKVNPNWQVAGYPFYRAAYLELAEFAEQVNTWKWWKGGQRGPRDQALLELVDTFHFVLSDAIITGRNEHVVFGSWEKASKRVPKKGIGDAQLYEDIDAFIEIMLTQVRHGAGIPIAQFFDIVVSFGATLDELLTGYIAKNVLNTFRQDNGYKQDRYVKEWGPSQEDNHWLSIFVEELGDTITFDRLYDKLSLKYQEVLSNQVKA